MGFVRGGVKVPAASNEAGMMHPFSMMTREVCVQRA
jgi:hypothetical protein